jgi:IS5 family transposase
MGQLGFFDIANRYASLDAKNDPLVKIDEVVPWGNFRVRLEATWRTPPLRSGSRMRGASLGMRW